MFFPVLRIERGLITAVDFRADPVLGGRSGTDDRWSRVGSRRPVPTGNRRQEGRCPEMTTLIRIGRRLAAPDGFTLVELIVVLGVISAIAMVAVAL